MTFFLKINRFIITILIAILAFQAIAKNPGVEVKHEEIDSLLKILPNSPPEQKVNILLSLSRIYLSFSLDSSEEYAMLALDASKELQDHNKTAESFKLLGNIAMYKGEMNNVISSYDSSILYFKLAGDSIGRAKVWNNLGIIYHNLGDYQKSIDFHLQSLDFKLKLSDSAGISNSYNNIGSIYLELGEYSKSYDYFQRALKLSRLLNQRSNVASILNNLGMIGQEAGDQEKAINYFNESLKVGEGADNFKGMADSYHNLGKSYYLLGNYTKALEYYNQAIDTYEKLGIDNSNTYNNIAQVFIVLENYKEALAYLNKAIRFAIENNQIKTIRDVYQNFSVAYEEMGWYKNALESYILFNQYDDSLKTMMHSSMIEEMMIKYEIEKKQEEIERANLELKNKESAIEQRNLVIYSIIAGLIIALVFVGIIMRLLKQKTHANEMLQTQNDEILRSQEIIKKINEALTEKEGQLRSIFDISPYGIFVVDDELKIRDCNETSLKMFHVDEKSSLKNIRLNALFIDKNGISARNNILKLITEGKLNKEQLLVGRTEKDAFPAEVTSREIYSEDDKTNLFIVVITDITERLSFIESLQESKIRAIESDKLKTAFLANMSHEIRTPMNSIVGFSNLLNDSSLPEEKREEYLAHILQSSNILLTLIEDIIDISKIEAGQLNFNAVKFNLNSVAKEIFESFKTTNKKPGLDFKLSLPDNSENVFCNTDPLRFKQVVGNLISNAVKFTESGYIEFGYTIKDSYRKPTVEFYVKDTGIGIPEDKHQIIFERFRQIDDSQTRNYGGTGLGLSISKRLIELMDGSIHVDSVVGSGSVFYFTLPFIKVDDVSELENEEEVPEYDWKNNTILVAEDEDSNFELIKATLMRTGINLIHKKNGEEAVQYVKSGKKVDIVLMDIRMPKLNGYDATRMIKSFNPNIPVISITAYAMSEDEAKSLQAGCDLYMSKPIYPTKLLEVLNEFIS